LFLYHSSIAQRDFDKLVDHLKNRLGVHIAFPPAALNLNTKTILQMVDKLVEVSLCNGRMIKHLQPAAATEYYLHSWCQWQLLAADALSFVHCTARLRQACRPFVNIYQPKVRPRVTFQLLHKPTEEVLVCRSSSEEHLKNRLGVHIAFPPAALNLLTTAPTNKYLLGGFVFNFSTNPPRRYLFVGAVVRRLRAAGGNAM
jgi:hypothetical protein